MPLASGKALTALAPGDTIFGFDALGNNKRIDPADVGGVGPEGPSAYEVAVANGFVGTEAAWLASLVGDQGPQGIQGLQGDPGPQGDVGPQGDAGPPGSAGPQGDPGPSVVPDEYGVFTEATVTAVETADVDYNFLIIGDGDDRVNNTLPAGIAGDMSGHLVRFETATNTWLDLGPIVGVAGPAGPQGDPGVQGAAGAQGPAGAAGSKWYSGAGVPSVGVGVNGDYYLNGTNGDYYVKAAGAWGAAAGNIKGPQGVAGTNGANGADGAPGGTLYGVNIYNAAGVANGGYFISPKLREAVTLTKVYAKKYGGTGAFSFTLMKNGAIAYGPIGPLTTEVDTTGLTLAFAAGDEMTIIIEPDATVTGVWVEFTE